MTATRHTGAPHSRQDTLIGMRNCLEFLVQESRSNDLTLTQWLLRMAIASLDEEMTAKAPGSGLDLVAARDGADRDSDDRAPRADCPSTAAD